MRVRPAEFLERHLLAGHRLDHVRAGDEHVRGSLHHQGEVRDGRRVDRAARTRAHDQRDLRDHPGGHDVPVEDLAEQPERDHPLLDPRPAAVVEADDRAAHLQRVVHHLDDLGAVHLAERSAEDGEVLAEHGDGAAVHGAVPGDHAVRVRPVLGDTEVGGPVPGELVELHERARIQEPLDPLPRGQLPLLVLLDHRLLRARVRGLLAAPRQVGDLPRRGVRAPVLVLVVAVGNGVRLGGSITGHEGKGTEGPAGCFATLARWIGRRLTGTVTVTGCQSRCGVTFACSAACSARC